jgi:hypothetical protein
MTITITVKCDAMGCQREIEINDNHDSDIEGEGWTVNPYDGYQHYCEACWPQVKSEIMED